MNMFGSRLLSNTFQTLVWLDDHIKSVAFIKLIMLSVDSDFEEPFLTCW